MNTPALIPIAPSQIDGQQCNTVNARDLHTFLEIGKDFSTWIKDRIESFGFTENQDFVCSPILGSEGRGGHNRKEYHLTLDMAKELSMVERNDKGKEARLYFLACERQAKQITIDPMTCLNDPAAMRGLLLTYTTRVIDLEEEKKVLLPKAQALDLIATSDGSLCLTDAAKVLQIRRDVLIKYLSTEPVLWIYKRYGCPDWIGYQDKLQQGVTEHKLMTIEHSDGRKQSHQQVRITSKGLAILAEVFSKEVTV